MRTSSEVSTSIAASSGKLFGTVVVGACVVVVSGEDSPGEVGDSGGGGSTGDSGGGGSTGRGSRSGGASGDVSCGDVPGVVEVGSEGTAGVSLGALSRGGGVVETCSLPSPHEAATKATAAKPISTAKKRLFTCSIESLVLRM